jgi:hypothetical protein
MIAKLQGCKGALHAFGDSWLRLSLRRFVAGIMLIMGLGRLGLYATFSLAMSLTVTQYGTLLVILGLALWPNGRFRLSIGGRIIAALGAILMFGMAWDVGTLGVTALIETWMALALLKETFTSHDC